MSEQGVCPKCHGIGVVNGMVCSTCNGTGNGYASTDSAD